MTTDAPFGMCPQHKVPYEVLFNLPECPLCQLARELERLDYERECGLCGECGEGCKCGSSKDKKPGCSGGCGGCTKK